MRVAILGSRGIPANYGGFETFAEEISVRLAQQGIDVTVYCEGSHDNRDTYKSVTRVFRTVPQLGAGGRLWFDVKCLWDARNKYDVVYMLGYGAGVFCFIPRIWGTQVWINMDGVEWARPKWKWYARFWLKVMEGVSLRTASRIIADADAICTFLKKRHSIMPECSVIPYGTSVAESPPSVSNLQKWGIEPGEYYLIVGRIEAENHIVEIIRGFLASSTTFPLLIIGDTDAHTPYANIVRSLQNTRVRLIGSEYEKSSLMALRYYCAAHLHGHSVGGTNPSLVEALGAGSAIIAHDNEFNREVVGDLGYYFTLEEQIPMLMTQIQNLGIERRAALRKKILKRAKSCYSWDEIQRMYMDLVEKVVSVKR